MFKSKLYSLKWSISPTCSIFLLSHKYSSELQLLSLQSDYSMIKQVNFIHQLLLKWLPQYHRCSKYCTNYGEMSKKLNLADKKINQEIVAWLERHSLREVLVTTYFTLFWTYEMSFFLFLLKDDLTKVCSNCSPNYKSFLLKKKLTKQSPQN